MSTACSIVYPTAGTRQPFSKKKEVRPLLKYGAMFGFAYLALADVGSSSQLRAQSPSFDVASVKPQPWKGEGGVGVSVHGNTLAAEHCTLYDLVEFAYNLRDIQLSGGPNWARHGMLASSDFYQVIAKTEDNPPPSISRFRLLLQALLSDRFQLRVHHIEKDLPVYHLVSAKNGPKLRESSSDTKFSLIVRSVGTSGKGRRIAATHASIAQVSKQFEHSVGRPVFDRTQLTGLYDFEIEWTPDNSATAGLGELVADADGSSLFTALQQRLGLRLEPGTAAFDILVIDHAEKPSAN